MLLYLISRQRKSKLQSCPSPDYKEKSWTNPWSNYRTFRVMRVPIAAHGRGVVSWPGFERGTLANMRRIPCRQPSSWLQRWFDCRKASAWKSHSGPGFVSMTHTHVSNESAVSAVTDSWAAAADVTVVRIHVHVKRAIVVVGQQASIHEHTRGHFTRYQQRSENLNEWAYSRLFEYRPEMIGRKHSHHGWKANFAS